MRVLNERLLLLPQRRSHSHVVDTNTTTTLSSAQTGRYAQSTRAASCAHKDRWKFGVLRHWHRPPPAHSEQLR